MYPIGTTVMEDDQMPQTKAIARYDAKNTKHIGLKLNIKTDEDILERLARETSVQGFIKECIRERIAKEEQ